MNKTFKKVLSVVLSLAMVLTSITVYNATAKADGEENDYATWVTETRNLAYQKSYTVYSKRNADWVDGAITDGNITDKDNRGAIDVQEGGQGYFDIDLGESYAASSIDQVVVWFRCASTYVRPRDGYKIQFSTGSAWTTVAEVKAEDYPTPAEGQSDIKDGNQYMVPTELDKDKLIGNVSKVRILVESPAGWGVQVAEIAVFSEHPEDPVTLDKCEDAADVTVVSDGFNSITFEVEAAEGQSDYTYNVFLDETTEIATGISARESITVSGIGAGKHIVKVISVCAGKEASDGISKEVEVRDISELITGTKNVASVQNNEKAKVDSVSSYDEDRNHNIDTAQKAIDGVIKSGEGVNDCIRTAWENSLGANPETIVIDLGNNYTPSEFDRVLLVFNSANTYAANATISFSNDKETYTEVGSVTGYSFSPIIRTNEIKLNKINEYTEKSVRYVQITLSKGQAAWGYVVNNIGVILNVDVKDATIVDDSETTDYTVTIDDVPAEVVDGKVQLGDAKYGYFCNEKMYAPNTEVKVTEDMAFTSVNKLELTMTTGASLKTAKPTGLRFKADITTDNNDAVKSGAITTGMLITAEDILRDNDELNLDADYTKLNIENKDVWAAEVGDVLTYCGGIVNIIKENYTRDFVARAYVTVTYIDGTSVEIYSNMSGERSVKGVAQSVLAKEELSDDVLAVVTEFANASDIEEVQ